jgi:CRISPR-associated protein Csm5
MPDYTVFKLNIAVVTPLHIGSGRELLNEYDYAIYNKQTWRINDAALLELQDVDDPALLESLAQTPPAQLLRDADFVEGSSIFRYTIRGVPRSSAAGAQVRELLKDTFDRPYLPGSSLKGAFRTALAWYAWGQLGLDLDLDKLRPSPRFAAQEYERSMFVQADARRGREPNYDALRALQVSDSQAQDASCLMLMNASVLNQAGQFGDQIPIELEAIRANTIFEAQLKLDLALFSEWARRHGLRLPGEDWLHELPQICRTFSRQRIQEELAWLSGVAGAERLIAAYRQLAQAPLSGAQFLLQVGWGAGWDSKTYGSHLRANRRLFPEIVSRYHMARGRRQREDPFPKSRRAAVAFTQSPQGQRLQTPLVPLGWLLVTMEPLSGATDRFKFSSAQETLLQPEEIQAALASERRPARPGRDAAQGTAQVTATAAPPKPPPAAPPAAHPKPAPAEALEWVASFSGRPEAGKCFTGKAYDTQANGDLLVEIPGLDIDDQAMAIIALADNPQARHYKPGAKVECQILRVEEDPSLKGYWLVYCRRL